MLSTLPQDDRRVQFIAAQASYRVSDFSASAATYLRLLETEDEAVSVCGCGCDRSDYAKGTL